MKILIYGGKGWIGTSFCKLLDNKYSYTLGTARVNNIDDLCREIDDIKPTHIFSFIGRTHGRIGETDYPTIDYLEQPGKIQENVRDNLFAPITLAKICESKNIHFTYLGTGCIFKYDDEHPFGEEKNGFCEEDNPNFHGSSYSIVKGYTDQLMSLFPKTLNLRIRMPIDKTPNSRNFITKITNYEKICSIPNSMSVLTELLPVALHLATINYSGTLNLTNPGLISHNEILEMYKEIVDPTFTWKNFTQEEQAKILAADRSNNYLSTQKLENIALPQNLKISPIKTAIRSILHQYAEKKVPTYLITGGCGFIGSNFINSILESNIKVVNIDNLNYCACENNVKSQSDNYKFIKGDICNMDLVLDTLNTHQPTHIIHFAAQSHVQNSFEDSLKYTKDNVMGTHTLLEAARIYGKIKKFIHISTDEVYGESSLDTLNKKTEGSILCPTNPYAATKAAAEMIATSYLHSFKLPVIITRGNNVYGPNQYPEKVIPRFIQQLKSNQKITIQGDGSCKRAFLHVDDAVSAFQKILELGKVGDIYNIGCDEEMEYSIKRIGEILIGKIKKTTDIDQWITYIEDRPFNDKRYYISNDKVKALGWEITIPLDQGLTSLL